MSEVFARTFGRIIKVPIIAFVAIFSVGFTGAMLENFILPFIATIIAVCVTLAADKKRQRSSSTIEQYGRVLGFRNFIKTAELDRLKMLSEENPNYFYDILGYAYAFGLESKWLSNFEKLEIPVQQPTWYVGMDPFTIHNFNTGFSRMMTHERNHIATSPNSGGSGGGGFSGGGFSGGGSGGGGGGAW